MTDLNGQEKAYEILGDFSSQIRAYNENCTAIVNLINHFPFSLTAKIRYFLGDKAEGLPDDALLALLKFYDHSFLRRYINEYGNSVSKLWFYSDNYVQVGNELVRSIQETIVLLNTEWTKCRQKFLLIIWNMKL